MAGMMVGLLISLLAALHLIAVGWASVGPLLVGCIRLATFSRDDQLDSRLREMAKLAVFALIAAAVVGLFTGYLRYLLNDSSYTAMLARFPHRFYLLAGLEWAFTLCCLLGWTATWPWGRRHPYAHGLLVLVAATNLLYHFPPIMFLQRMLADRPDLVAAFTVTRPLALTVIWQSEIIMRTLHFIAIASQISFAIMTFWAPSDPSPAIVTYRRVASWGGAASTLCVILSGIAMLVVIPGYEAARFMGGSLIATLAMLTTVALSLATLMGFLRLALQPMPPKSHQWPLVLSLLAVLLMTFADRPIAWTSLSN